VLVKNINGKTFTLNTESSEKINNIKEKIQIREGIPINQ
jgi:uncharacterized protein YlzI (FlbEa/FlbD family)